MGAAVDRIRLGQTATESHTELDILLTSNP